MSSISDKVRKTLWAKSGNACAMCKKPLVLENALDGKTSVVGDECHIVSQSKGGPRYDDNFPPDKIDCEENLILLCKVHHKLVDDNPKTYSKQVLEQIKQNHEKSIKERIAIDPSLDKVRIVRNRNEIPKALIRITSGKQLEQMLEGCMASYQNWDENLSDEETELVGGFLQTVQDYADLLSDMEPIERVRASHEIQKEIEELEKSGFWLFAAKEKQVLKGGAGADQTWNVLHITVLRETNEEIMKIKVDDA